MLATSTHALLADQYLDRLAFGWQRRQRARTSHVLDFAALRQLDQNLCACVQALALTGNAAPALIAARLEEPLTASELFAIALYSIETSQSALHDTCLGLILALPNLRAAYVAALEWSSASGAWWALQQWQRQDSADTLTWLFDVMALALCRTHTLVSERLCNSHWWQQLLAREAHNPAIGYALMQTALARPALQQQTRASALLQSPLGRLRGLAAEVILWQTPAHSPMHSSALEVLSVLARDPAVGGNDAQFDACLALACWPATDFNPILTALAAQPEQHRLYLQALGWRGDIRAIPILIDHLNQPHHARLAAASLSMLTGSLPARDGWQAEPPEVEVRAVDSASDQIEATDPDAALPPPDRVQFEAWWTRHRAQFGQPGGWLAGNQATASHLMTLLASGKLGWRVVAARRMQGFAADRSRLDTSATSSNQLQWLANHSTPLAQRHAP